MKYYKTVVVPETTKQELDKTICDICGSVIKEIRNSADKVSIQCKTGHHYSDGGSGEIEGVDVCTSCWSSEVVPWLKSKGCTIHTVDWDW